MTNSNNTSEMCLSQVYELDQCVQWIENNSFNSIALQFSRKALENSSSIALILKKRTQIEYYVTVSTMCCVDYLTIKHLTDTKVDAIIYFGGLCLTSSQFSDSLPVLHVFGNSYKEESIDFIKTSMSEMESKKTLILYDTAYTVTAIELFKRLEINQDFNQKFCLGKLNVLSNKWNFTSSVLTAIQTNNSENNDEVITFGPFIISENIINYDLVVYLGQCNSLAITLNCNNLLEINIINKVKTLISSAKELRKRVAKIEKFKQNSCDSIGIIFTNPLPNVNKFYPESKLYAKKLKKKVYFMSLVQTLDEYKLGNFSQLNGFVVVNSCHCSSVLNSFDYCFPILSWTEFEIASGLRTSYGNVEWNTEEANDSDTEEIEETLNNSQLIGTDIFRPKKWFGLEVDCGSKEASVVKTGQTGIASFYENEDHF